MTKTVPIGGGGAGGGETEVKYPPAPFKQVVPVFKSVPTDRWMGERADR